VARRNLYFDTGVNQQKDINLRTNPHVILTTGCNHWEPGLDVVVAGDAVRVTDDDQLEQLAGVWATRWDGNFQFVVRGGYFRHAGDESLPAVVVFSVTPLRSSRLPEEAAPPGHTTHRF
jgi:hypothetical protein